MLQNQLDIEPNCKNFKSLPDIRINLKSRKYNNKNKEYEIQSIILKPEDYIIEGKKIKKRLEGIDSDFLGYAKEECQEAFMPIDVPRPRGPIFVFGEYFLRKFYTVFDRDRNIMGFSVANHNAKDINYHNLNIKTPYDDTDTDELIKIPNIKNMNLNENGNTKENVNVSDNKENEVKKLQHNTKQISLNSNNNDNNNKDNNSVNNNNNHKDVDNRDKNLEDIMNLDNILNAESSNDNNNNFPEISEFEKFNKDLNSNNNDDRNSHNKDLHLELDIDLL
jgi:hypothetical protein